ncbi:tRNA-dihydrouridine(20a/20b) synthase [NAD(P)(+)] [Malassezia cuniculi]|uniref:tRNA-dihydrouridine synthase n=1 Tax=Malassezia cuniculi TaxID=948313 RepID=A0AAF0EXV9_9BASI|nr:tRNA-dihydrouridine(20a/20b) synthase [NAD(P)(+)] [Malassezia cuniculi]
MSDAAEPAVLPPHHLLNAFPNINVCAPMVRYSKLPFRALVARYDTHITTTPMILATEFSRNAKARDSDFTTNGDERYIYNLADNAGNMHTVRGALVCQLASSEASPLADAAELLQPYVDGIDLNCGCPQPWAYAEQLGSYLLRQPETVADMVRTIKARMADGFCVSVKIRIDEDLRRTDTLVRNALHAGASMLTIHGRTRTQPSQSYPVNLDGVKFAVESANACGLHTPIGTSPSWSIGEDGGSGGIVPTVVNGDIWTREDAIQHRTATGARGAMSARGLLANPALFAGHATTPQDAVATFVDYAAKWGLHPALFQYVYC